MKRTLLSFSLFLSVCVVSAQITLNQVDDFQDGTTQNWQIGSAGGSSGPINVADAGPAGLGDNCLQYTSNGIPDAVASRMIFYTQNQQWSEDFISEGVDQISMDVKVETNDLNLRIAMQGSGTRICTTNAINVPANGIWTNITFPIAPSDFTVVNGSSDESTVLANVMTLRILSNSVPEWLGEEIDAIIQVDNITAQSSLSTPRFDNQDTEFRISPNPSKDKLNIVLPSDDEMRLEVFDVLGKRVYSGLISQLSRPIDISNWRSGVYLVRVSNDKTTQSKRFIKQ
ncbi:T9SS type A sorting domain-containing protein [Winogradskyella sp.]|uniref:T9SS type A sorting domain-containing protein n=1 Tax=Winogradskyella sp. TaxID=1883156 RepID=UPI00261F9993|nr:T9SS type A sorting domain-containing protein [Winogradskyella sp.]